MLRRGFLRLGVALGAPMVNIGRCRLSASPGPVYSTRTLDLVSQSLVIDMLGLLTMDWGKLARWQRSPEAFTRQDFDRVRSSGVGVFHPAVELNALDPYTATRRCFEGWKSFVSSHPGWFRAVFSAGDFETAKASGNVGLLIGSQNSCHFRSASDVSDFHTVGQRVSQLTYNTRNQVGGGCLDRVDHGLTDFGAGIVDAMNSVGMAVDVSHSGERTTLDAIELSRRPVLITHSNCSSLTGNHPRCKRDHVIQRLSATGGVMGITGIRPFVRNQEPTTLDHMLDHFDHVARIAGIEHVGIGSDMSLEQRPSRPRVVIPGFDHPFRIYDLTEGLLERGYTTASIGLVLGGNFRRALSEIWSERPAA